MKASSVICYLALGSNLGDRHQNLRSAIAGLTSHSVSVVRTASVYFTEPKDVPDQPWFYNTVVEVETSWTPEELLDVCLKVEQQVGRERTSFKGPRTLDIDILFFGSQSIHTDRLTVPHPRLHDRRFVLEPMAEIAPDFLDPLRHKTIRQLLDETPDSGVVRRLILRKS